MTQSVRLAIDGMGGDHGPVVTIAAVVEALALFPNISITWIGNTALWSGEWASALDALHSRLTLLHTEESVAMDELPQAALRNKRQSSMRLMTELVKSGEAQAGLSAGNTGALMAISRFVLKMLPGVDRPAIIYPLPADGKDGPCFVRMLDLGANVDCTETHLLQFAIMGNAFSQALDGLAQPRVALLNIGQEEIKGTDAVKKTNISLLQMPNIHYVGFIEGDDLYRGHADVVVCDGFVGNVALKSSEGVARMLLESIRNEFHRNIYTRLIGLLAKPMLMKVRHRLDPSRHNGGTLLGLKGSILKSHGGAKVPAFIRAIEEAALVAQQNIPARIEAAMGYQPTVNNAP